MKLRQLFENRGNSVGVCFGRWNPPHKGHKAAWEIAASFGTFYVGTNKNTEGPNDPLPYEVKLKAMETIWPEIAGHVIPEQSLFTLVSRIFAKHGERTHLKVATDEEWLAKSLMQYNGKEGAHGYYKFASIEQVPTPRLSSATALRAAVRAGDRDGFSDAAGVDADTPIRIGKKTVAFFDLVAHYLAKHPEKVKKVKKVAEHKKGVRAIKYTKKPVNPSAQHAKAKEKLAPVKPGVEKQTDECAGVGTITKQNSTGDVNKGTPYKNLKAFNLVKETSSDLTADEMVAILSGQKTQAQVLADRNKPATSGVIPMAQWTNRAKSMLAKGMSEQQVVQQFVKDGLAIRLAQQAVQAAQMNEIAGAFPSPSTREKWAKDAAASNAAEAQRLAAKKAAADAERLKVNNAIVDKEQRINYHPMPDNEVPAKEGTVHQFPKKHKGDLSDTHDCPKCGGDLQGGKYMGHAVKVCMPCKQVYLPPNSGIDQKGNKIDEYGDTAKGQKMLTKVQKRAVDRVTSKKADTDPKYAKKNSDTADRAWDRMTDLDEAFLQELEAAMLQETGMKKIDKTQKAAMKNAATLPALNMSTGSGGAYMNYRMGIALAGAPNFPTKMEADNWIGGDPLLSTYTEEEFDMIKAAAKQVGAGTIQNWSGKRSEEVADVNKTSTVAKIKRNKYGV